jgi:hypothetical protein
MVFTPVCAKAVMAWRSGAPAQTVVAVAAQGWVGALSLGLCPLTESLRASVLRGMSFELLKQ